MTQSQMGLVLALLAALALWPQTTVAGSTERLRWVMMGDNLSQRSREAQLAIRRGPMIEPAFKFISASSLDALQDQTLRFDCVDPDPLLFEQFVSQYNRTFAAGKIERLERHALFQNTIKRIILFNKLVQNEVLNATNYEVKPEIRNYHYISSMNGQNFASWYLDINDCELGLIKYTLFEIIYSINKNHYARAYRIALNNSDHLPYLDARGFQQLAEISLVRLFDRLNGDEKMNQLFAWPTYMKKLAAYAYNRVHVGQPNFKSKLALISFAYPSYYKDLRYNDHAIDRTHDNLAANGQHEAFNARMGRIVANNKERNKRLIIYRQRTTLIRLLMDEPSQTLNVSQQAEWLRIRRLNDLYPYPADATDSFDGRSARLQLIDEASESLAGLVMHLARSRFSDLTDAEFVAYLTNDFSLLTDSGARESINFIQQNFPVMALNDSVRNEIAAELLLRRTLQQHLASQPPTEDQFESSQRDLIHQRTAPMALARQVVDELIGDVGLPIGPISIENTPDSELHRLFDRTSELFGKVYASSSRFSGPKRSVNQPDYLPEPDENRMADERVRRFDTFAANYGRLKAWLIKEQWSLDTEEQQLTMLRLADMSWHEIKLSLFKLCCLSSDHLAFLSANNSTIHYLASNSFICQPISQPPEGGEWRPNARNDDRASISERLSARHSSSSKVDDLLAMELYYYYSLHFNKHRSDPESFNASFAIFRYNLEQIKRLSCARSLTLYRSLKTKDFATLNTIDVLDPRRSYTDDLNLDRFKYYAIPKLDGSPDETREASGDEPEGFERLRASPRPLVNDYSRSGVTYRRGPLFAGLLDTRGQMGTQQTHLSTYADLLLAENRNAWASTKSYRQRSIDRVYELVKDRYRFCARTVRQSEPSELELSRFQCLSAGRYVDQSASSTFARESQLTSSVRMELERKDPCAHYWFGLEPWGEGLLSQDSQGYQLIDAARCQA